MNGDVINIKGFRVTQYFFLRPTPARNWTIRFQKFDGCYHTTILISGYAIVIAIPKG